MSRKMLLLSVIATGLAAASPLSHIQWEPPQAWNFTDYVYFYVSQSQ